MKNNYILVLGIFLVFGLVIIARDSYANPVMDDGNKVLNLELIDNSNQDEFKKDVYNYISLIDDSLIPNTSYNISSKLNENYDFLTRFAISLILDNRDYYEIEILDEYKYIDEYGGVYTTDEYINIDMIYEITSKIFGVDYYYILSDYIEIDNDMIPLLVIDNREFNGIIDDIVMIDKFDTYMDVVVRYKDNNLDYVYKFERIDNQYVISDLSIRE